MKRTRIYGPMVEIGRLQAELNRLFAGILETQGTLPAGANWDPNADVVEEPGELTILVEVPGLSAAELSAGVQGTALIVRGTKRAPPLPGRPVASCAWSGSLENSRSGCRSPCPSTCAAPGPRSPTAF